MSLLHAEWRRLFKRRLTVWSLVLVLLVLGVTAVGIAFAHHKHSPAALAKAEARAAEEFELQQEWIERDIEQCERDKANGIDTGWPENCGEIAMWATPQEEMVEWFLPPTFEFRERFPEVSMVVVGLLSMYAFVIGGSFIGAEWRSGGLMNLLLWRPRRLRVYGAKLVALLGGLTAIYVAVSAVWTPAMWVVAMARGVTDTMTTGAWQSFALTGLRGLVLVLAAGAVSFGLASIGRHIAAALGSAVAAGVVGVVGVGIVVSLLQVKFPEAWVWTTYLEAWTDKVVVLQHWPSCEGVGAACDPETLEITWQTAGALMAGVVALVTGAAMWLMRRRDIT